MAGSSFKAAILLSGLAFCVSPSIATAGEYVRSWVDAKGGCKSSFRQLATLPHRGNTEFLGRKPEEWTDEMVEEYERVFVDCMLEVNTPTGMRPAPRGQRSPMYEETGRDKAQELRRVFVEPGRDAQRQRLAKVDAARKQSELEDKAAADRAAKAAEEDRREREAAAERAKRQEERRLAEDAEQRIRSERQAREAVEVANREREAAAEMRRQAETERKRLEEAKKIADDARREREAAEHELAAIRKAREAEEERSRKELRVATELREQAASPDKSRGQALPFSANPFDRAPDDFRDIINASLSSVGLPERVSAGTCETTRAYRSCEYELGQLYISVTGPVGGGSGTAQIMISNDAETAGDQHFVDAAGAVISSYAPGLSRDERTALFARLMSGLNGENRKGYETIEGTYFSLRARGNSVDFFAMRE